MLTEFGFIDNSTRASDNTSRFINSTPIPATHEDLLPFPGFITYKYNASVNLKSYMYRTCVEAYFIFLH